MGGTVCALFLESYPGVFSRVVLCAPMIAPNLGGLPPAVAGLICSTAHRLGHDKRRVFISKPYAGAEDFATSCATGRERFDWYDALRAATERYHNNGPTYGWTLESLKVTKKLLAPGKPEAIGIPVMIYTAEDDRSVLPEAQEQLARRLRKGTRKVVPGSRHEIYRSPDQVLFPWWHEILTFYEA
jgi:lysophospholipase